MAISMLKIRRPLGRLIFNMGIAIPGKTVFLIETAPRFRLYFDVTICDNTDALKIMRGMCLAEGLYSCKVGWK